MHFFAICIESDVNSSEVIYLIGKCAFYCVSNFTLSNRSDLHCGSFREGSGWSNNLNIYGIGLTNEGLCFRVKLCFLFSLFLLRSLSNLFCRFFCRSGLFS